MATNNIYDSSSEINVVLIGETGTGKSTFINYLTNLFYNGSLNNLKVSIPTRYSKANMNAIMPQHHENDIEDGTRSKTSRCIKYQFTVERVHFNFFDTPGINDTGGYLADNENVDRIFECIQNFEHLTALVLVLNGTQARLTVNIRNVLERFRDRIPDVLYSNLLVILTNCASHTVNFGNVKLLNNAPIYHMQNSAFSSDPKMWSVQTREILQRDWNISMQTMNDFIKNLLTLQPISTGCLTSMNDDRNAIRSVLHESRLMIMELQHVEDELVALEQASNIYSANIEKYASASGQSNKSIQVNEITVTSYHNTICSKCNTVCHERCSLTETTRIGERVFRRCTVIVNGRCTICSGKCSYDMHYHDRRLIKNVPKTLKVAISSLVNKYSEARKDKVSCETKCETVQETKRLIEQSLQDQFHKVREACRRVKSNCRGFNVAEELCVFVSFLKNDVSALRSTSVIQKATKFIGKLEILADELQHDDSSVSLIDSSMNLMNVTSSISAPIVAQRKSHGKQNTKHGQTSNHLNQITDEPCSIESLSHTIQTDHAYHNSMVLLSPKDDTDEVEDDQGKRKSSNPLGIRDSFRRHQEQMPKESCGSIRKYAEYTTEQLVSLSRDSADECKSIGRELNRRCGGTSIGYLPPTQLLTLCEYYSSSRILQPDELLRLQSQLQSDIHHLTDHDPFEILSVPNEKILHLAAVTLCLQNNAKY